MSNDAINRIPIVTSLSEEKEKLTIGTLGDPWSIILIVAIILLVILFIILIIFAVSRNNQKNAEREVYELRRDIEVKNTGLGNDVILIKERRPYIVGYKKEQTETPIVGYKEKSNYID